MLQMEGKYPLLGKVTNISAVLFNSWSYVPARWECKPPPVFLEGALTSLQGDQQRVLLLNDFK